MNRLMLIVALASLCIATAQAAPGDQVDASGLTNKVSLNIGSKGAIRFKQQRNALTEPTLIKGPAGKQPGVDVEFKKEPKFLALILKNRLSKALLYRAALRLKGHKEYVETSLIVPVNPGLMSFEAWQDPIDELVLFAFKLTDQKL
jgi:hypothetical protein